MTDRSRFPSGTTIKKANAAFPLGMADGKTKAKRVLRFAQDDNAFVGWVLMDRSRFPSGMTTKKANAAFSWGMADRKTKAKAGPSLRSG